MVCPDLCLQVEAIKQISEYVAQLRRVGKGHGEYLFISFQSSGNSSSTRSVRYCSRLPRVPPRHSRYSLRFAIQFGRAPAPCTGVVIHLCVLVLVLRWLLTYTCYSLLLLWTFTDAFHWCDCACFVPFRRVPL